MVVPEEHDALPKSGSPAVVPVVEDVPCDVLLLPLLASSLPQLQVGHRALCSPSPNIVQVLVPQNRSTARAVGEGQRSHRAPLVLAEGEGLHVVDIPSVVPPPPL